MTEQASNEPLGLFLAIPNRVLGMKDLTGTDWRVLAAIAKRDNRSLEGRGNGLGCFASTSTLAEELGITREAVSRSITKLIKAGVIQEDEKRFKRSKVLRVIYSEVCAYGHKTNAQDDAPAERKSDHSRTGQASSCDQNKLSCDRGNPENGSFSRRSASQEMKGRDELKRFSSEEARLSSRAKGQAFLKLVSNVVDASDRDDDPTAALMILELHTRANGFGGVEDYTLETAAEHLGWAAEHYTGEPAFHIFERIIENISYARDGA